MSAFFFSRGKIPLTFQESYLWDLNIARNVMVKFHKTLINVFIVGIDLGALEVLIKGSIFYIGACLIGENFLELFGLSE